MSCPDMARHVCWCTIQLFYFPQPADVLWIKHRGEHLFLAQASRRGYSHFKITANLCVICLFKFKCIQYVQWFLRLCHFPDCCGFNCILDQRHTVQNIITVYLHHCEHWILLNINILCPVQVSSVLFFCSKNKSVLLFCLVLFLVLWSFFSSVCLSFFLQFCLVLLLHCNMFWTVLFNSDL